MGAQSHDTQIPSSTALLYGHSHLEQKPDDHCYSTNVPHAAFGTKHHVGLHQSYLNSDIFDIRLSLKQH